jgi:hypothetical protein
VGKLQPLSRHPQADQRHDEHVGVVGVARFCVEHRDLVLEPLAVEGEAAASFPQLGEEAGQHQLGPLARVGGNDLSP